MARWLVKNFKMLINTGESGIVYCMECWKYVGLTLTWDVLKHVLVGVDYLAELRLTLTWDVLKLVRQFICVSAKEINFNMRCIETDVHASILHFLYRLTLT